MSDLDRNYASPFGRAAGRVDAATVDAGLRAYMLRIYNYMSIGLAITGFAALGIYMAAVTSDPSGAAAKIGNAFLTPGVEDVVFCFLHFPSGKIAHLHLSWLDPHKMRKLTVVGRDKMAVFDDMELERKVTIYEKWPEQAAQSYGEWQTRTGDILSPKIPTDEPLRLELSHFMRLVREGSAGQEARDGLAVVRVLERLQDSLES